MNETPSTGQGPQTGQWLTTSTGTRLRDTDQSLRAGERGPVLLADHHLREKLTHFDHERIPERVVHARGAGARGTFTSYGTASSVTCAAFLQPDAVTPVFTRFSTVLGSRGSADTVRDTRGFATKFYTSEGNFDLVGNNIPVFFIQDGIKFPDVVHAAKPHPDTEIPQAQSAHDTFWDFVSLHTEAQHHTMWNMSGRGIPRSYRMLEGFGVHTFRMVNVDGETTLVKFHWRPKVGTHSLVWEEAQLLAGIDPDFHRRDLYDAIDAGVFPEWELSLQTFPDTDDQTFEGIDLLDSTKMVPEELAPLQPVGRLVLDQNPTNFFAETEQVAFHVGHLVPGIDVTDDPLLAGRLFSYVDTQLLRLGGPNFNQIPVNRPHTEANDMLRDGFHQHRVHEGVAPYQPNSMDGGCPFQIGLDPAPDAPSSFQDLPVRVPEARRTRQAPASFADHFTQPRLFWLSMSPVEQQQIVDAYAFELGKCRNPEIQQRQIECLARIDTDLCTQVADKLGLPAPDPLNLPDVTPSPALSTTGQIWPVDGRLVGVLVGRDSPVEQVTQFVETLATSGVRAHLIAANGAPLNGDLEIVRALDTVRSVEFDAVALAPGSEMLAADPRVEIMLAELARHGKSVVGWGAAGDAADPASAAQTVIDELSMHRSWAK